MLLFWIKQDKSFLYFISSFFSSQKNLDLLLIYSQIFLYMLAWRLCIFLFLAYSGYLFSFLKCRMRINRCWTTCNYCFKNSQNICINYSNFICQTLGIKCMALNASALSAMEYLKLNPYRQLKTYFCIKKQFLVTLNYPSLGKDI